MASKSHHTSHPKVSMKKSPGISASSRALSSWPKHSVPTLRPLKNGVECYTSTRTREIHIWCLHATHVVLPQVFPRSLGTVFFFCQLSNLLSFMFALPCPFTSAVLEEGMDWLGGQAVGFGGFDPVGWGR
jgi:hypothetical protein